MNYENNKLIDGDMGIEGDQFNISLTSSIRDFSSRYIHNVLVAINNQLNQLGDIRKSQESEQSEKESLTDPQEEAKRITALYGNISDSESADVDDYDDNGSKLLASVCTDTINVKVKTLLKSMTGIEAVIQDKKTVMTIQGQPQIEEERNTMSPDNNSANAILSSTISQTAAEMAKDYLANVYNNTIRKVEQYEALDPSWLTESAVPEPNEIQFVREVTEETFQGSGKYLFIHKNNCFIDAQENVKDYLSGLIGTMDNMIQESVISDSSLDLSENQNILIQNYILKVYAKAEYRANTFNENDSIESISVSNSNKAIASNYVQDMFKRIHVDGEIQESTQFIPEDSDEEEYFPAPAINVIEDNTQFLVSKHLLGIKQEGYENAFSPEIKVKNNLQEKARVMSAKGGRKDPNQSSQTKPEPESEKEEEQKRKPKVKVSENDEDYIKNVLMG